MHPQDEPPSLQTLGLLRARETSVLPQKCLSASRAGRCVLPAFGASLQFPALSSFPPITYRHCPQDRGAPSLPSPEWPARRFLRLLWVLVPYSSCGPKETRLPPVSHGAAVGSASPPPAASAAPGSCLGEPACGYFLWLFPLVCCVPLFHLGF